jgi:hypothetical protein
LMAGCNGGGLFAPGIDSAHEDDRGMAGGVVDGVPFVSDDRFPA